MLKLLLILLIFIVAYRLVGMYAVLFLGDFWSKVLIAIISIAGIIYILLKISKMHF